MQLLSRQHLDGRSWDSAQQQHLASTAAWMRAPQQQRAHPMQRAAQRSEQRADGDGHTLRPRAHGPRRAVWWHSFDAALPAHGCSPPWAGVWQRLHRIPAPREHRLLAWRVLHGALPVGARMAAWGHVQGDGGVGAHPVHLCQQPTCMAASRPETLTHVFLDCPIARHTCLWAARLWAAVTGRPPPPVCMPVFLAGDHRQWDPGDAHSVCLWHTIRLAVLFFLWANRCAGREHGRPRTALAVVAQVVQYLRARMRGDAVRVSCSRRHYAPIGAVDLLPDRVPISHETFVARWAANGVLCSWLSPCEPLIVHLSLVHPVAPPSSSTS